MSEVIEPREELVEALRRDAEEHIRAGTIILPVNVDAFAERMVKANKNPLVKVVRKMSGFGMLPDTTKEEYVAAIKKVCEELKLEIK
jgi:hypothetical protein